MEGRNEKREQNSHKKHFNRQHTYFTNTYVLSSSRKLQLKILHMLDKGLPLLHIVWIGSLGIKLVVALLQRKVLLEQHGCLISAFFQGHKIKYL